MSTGGNGPRPDGAESSGGRGNQTGGRSNGGRGRGGRGKNQGQQSNTRFQGQEPSLKDCVFDYSEDPQSKRYLRNVELLVGYVGTSFDYYNLEYQKALEKLELKDPEKAKVPDDPTDPIQMEEWKMEYKARKDQVKAYRNFRASLFSVILGQCTPLMKDKLQAKPEYEAINDERDGVALLKLIKQTTFTFDSGRIYKLVGRDKLKEEFYGLKRRNNQTLHSYYEVFRAKVKVLNEVGVVLYDKDLVEMIAKKNGRDTPASIDRDEAQERCVAIRFIRTCGHREYEAHLQNMFLDGHKDVYPATLADARAILDNRMTGKQKQPNQNQQTPTENATGMAYHTQELDDSNECQAASTLTGNSHMTTNSRQTQSRNGSGNNSRGREQASTGNGQSRGHESNQTQTNNNGELNETNESTGLQDTHRDSLQYSFSASSSQASISPEWLLLDNQSTVDIIRDSTLLKNIHTAERPIMIQSHAGRRQISKQGLLPGYGIVWHDPKGPANIISLNNARTMFSIKYDSENGNTFNLFDRSSGRLKHQFLPSQDGLFYMDTSRMQSSFITTVNDNESAYSQDEVYRAKLARSLMAKIGRPSTRDFVHIIRNNLLPNTTITVDDIKRAEKIYGPDLGSLKGKTTRRKSPVVDSSQTVPPRIKEEHKDVTLTVDILHVNNIPFLATTSRKLHFGTMEAMANTTDDDVMNSLRRVVAIYRRGGLRPRMLLADGAFCSEKMKTELQLIGVLLNPTARDEHVGDIERYIRTVKERMRCVYNTLPFKEIPKVMIIEMAKFATFWLNSFPHRLGISQSESPRLLVTGEQVDFNKHCRFEFGQYVQCHEEHDNSMAPRTIGALALRPTGNRQGSYYFLSLVSGRVITRNHATALPMPQEVIQRVHQLARAQNMQPGLAFGNRDNRILWMDQDNDLYNEEDDESYINDEQEDIELRYDDDMIEDELVGADNPEEDVNGEPAINPMFGPDDQHMEIQGVGDPLAGELDLNGPEIEGVEADGELPIHPMAEDDGSAVPEEAVMDVEEDVEENGGELAGGEDMEEGQDIQDIDANEGTEDNSEADPVRQHHQHQQQQQQQQQHRYNLRPNRERSYAHRYGHSFACIDTLKGGRYDGILRDGVLFLVASEVNQATPQMPMKKGIKLFGNKGVAAVKVEIQQLHDRGVLRAVHKTDLSWNEVQQALGYLMFLKRKRCGKIKGRGCADGRKQRAYIEKEDSASPTVATDSVFITAVIDALERRVVAVADIPGAFMHSDMDPGVYMRLTGLMAELLLEVDHEAYAPYLTYEKGEPVIYVEMLKALYGTLRAARLFWEKLTVVLKSWGFQINPYDSCVANKTINNKQCTVTWHIDDLKISHVDGAVVTKFIEDLKAEFGQLGEISVSEGTRHDYLGMFLDYGEDGVVQVDMRSYLDTILISLPKEWIGKARSPAAKHLYHTDPNSRKLNEEEADRFHSVTMQLAYMAQRGRPDIRTAVAFLSTRVMNPDVDDQRKLGWVLKYLQSTKDLILRLEGDGSGTLCWWVDASFATHPDMKGQTGGVMTMGKGAVMTASSKQKLVARSSTECELIGVHDVLPSMLWSQNFLRAQGHEVKNVVLHQDNQSSILLERNGRLSSSKRTKHINLRYFYITDCIRRKDVNVRFCPTDEMIADFFTKPLQGQAFYRLRDIIMNVVPSSKYHSSAQRSVLRICDQATSSCEQTTSSSEQAATQECDSEAKDPK